MGLYADITLPPKALPQAKLTQIAPAVSLLPPLSRRGHGPGMILIVSEKTEKLMTDGGFPAPIMKWAEEGYTVVEVHGSALSAQAGPNALETAISGLKACEGFEDTGKVGIVVYDAQSWNNVAPLLASVPEISGAVVYGDQAIAPSLAEVSIPVLRHLSGVAAGLALRTPLLTVYSYPNAKSQDFASSLSKDFSSTAEAVSHSRNVSFIKPLVGGPFFDIEAIWEEHTYYEFADRSVEHTMSTMVQEPYVNHVPTMTGGVGRTRLTTFYRDHFIFNNSADTELELISRTVGTDRVIDEFIFKFTHDQEVDWLIPGIPPTGLKVEVPFTAVVNIRGDRLYHEHIAWDQGTVLRQLGLMPEYLPYPYPLPDGKVPAEGNQFEYKVPVGGIETADKMRDKNLVASNQMFAYKIRETPKSS
ncbi:hypothetical protein S40285_07926 [Stachybotrys chlorohalonatus IBT 40285]|uniref:SnoaL-like domain-containing protein n=1 Tax=Stachybotrys chlorohalonatus (strain IBT 40285) TaxID=1283841 RepID=A0A084R104_STAC4|nr:hypothetical protein S40285_07926 [Stachybotrys chlorohalonata IBT 40285]